MGKYDIDVISVSIARTMKCEFCPYRCKSPERADYLSCQRHWLDVLSKLRRNNRKTEYLLHTQRDVKRDTNIDPKRYGM